MSLILASSSPRRHQLLAALGIPFVVDVADIDEAPRDNEPPEAHVRRLAEEKARAVAARHPDDVVLAADTIVVHEGRILGKPADAMDAIEMLRSLRGVSHQVITAVAVAADASVVSDLDVSTVIMRDFSDEEIRAYVATGDPLDKAGAYAIQHPGFRPVSRLDGCFAGVMGLPLAVAACLLTRVGLQPAPHWPRNCFAITGRCCQLPGGVQ